MLCVDQEEYITRIVPDAVRLKIDTWGHENVILHSRDIRKARGHFAFLQDETKREPFYQRINSLMGDSSYQLIAIVILKQDHVAKYGQEAQNPYDLALTYSLERLVRLLEGIDQGAVTIVAESRGTKEDNDLKGTFYQLLALGTPFVSRERFRAIDFKLVLVPKSGNSIGTQMADLAGYPIARTWLNKRVHQSYEVIGDKFYSLKVFPPDAEPRNPATATLLGSESSQDPPIREK